MIDNRSGTRMVRDRDLLSSLVKTHGGARNVSGKSGLSRSFLHRLMGGEIATTSEVNAVKISEALRVPSDLLFVPSGSTRREQSVNGNATVEQAS